MWNYIWPICMVVLANVGYNIVTKSTPSEANALLSLTVTYLTAALFSFILYRFLGRGQTLSFEFSRLNWTSFALGICIIALEFGYIYVYRAGWKVNTASLTANIALACILVIVGFLIYKEVLSLRQIMGIGVCIAGLVLISG